MSDGLEGVVAARTVLSHVDGERGVLVIRGHRIEDLVAEHGYEGAAALLWEGFVGENLTRDSIRKAWGVARQTAYARLSEWLDLAKRRTPVDGARLCLAALPDEASPAEIAASLPVGVAALLRVRDGKAPVPPDPALGTAADFLRMRLGAPADDGLVRALDTYFTVAIDGGLSASTFTARVIASTRASLACAVTGAYCAFTGPIHGGAPEKTLDMLDEIAASGDIDAWLEQKLSSGGRLMGFGHRIYRTRDPRANALREALRKLGTDRGRLAFAADVEHRALAALRRFKPGRVLESNIEINAALLLDAVGLPREAFTPVFALARMPGWIAHALEQQKTGRMIRPDAAYIGPHPAEQRR